MRNKDGCTIWDQVFYCVVARYSVLYEGVRYSKEFLYARVKVTSWVKNTYYSANTHDAAPDNTRQFAVSRTLKPINKKNLTFYLL